MAIEFGERERPAGEAFLRLAKATDEFEAYAQPHASRLAALADALAAHFRLSRADRTAVVFAALLHDLGEVAMRRDYIGRPGPLKADERIDLQRHPVIGEQEAARAGADRAVQLLIRWHQEWWSGAGYPDALRGEQIPLGARILRVADAYAALTDARPWRPAGTESEARKHLTLWAGLEFDPQVVSAFLSLRGLAELRSYARTDDPEPEPEPEPVAEAPSEPTAEPAAESFAGPASAHDGRAEPSKPPAGEVVGAGEQAGENPWKVVT